MKNVSQLAGLLLIPCLSLPACGGDDELPGTTAGDTGSGDGETGGMESTTEDTGDGDGDTTTGDGDTTTGDGDGDGACGDGDGTGIEAFRIDDMWFRDPHFFVSLLGCNDYTDGGAFPVNTELNNSIDNDLTDPPDGVLDLSIMQVFRPLLNCGSGVVDVGVADCLAPAANTTCSTGMTALDSATYTTMTSGACLTPDPAHLSSAGYSPAPNTVNGPCYHATAQAVTVTLAGISVPLTDVELSATFDGNPADNLTTGVLKGFMAETVADMTVLPAEIPLLGGSPISELLPGGTGNCASHDDRDMHNGVLGWWFYADFNATRVPWTD